MSKNLKIIAISAIIIILFLVGFFAWKKFYQKPQAEETIKKAGEAAEIITESATRGVLPTINPTANPYENVSETNPIEKANPFKNIKTNPFE
ncbi:MAG: hypothetical protein AAB464_02075 [Patescibacteria group bacterium]